MGELGRCTFMAPVWMDPYWNDVLSPQLRALNTSAEPMLLPTASHQQLAEYARTRLLDTFLKALVPMFHTPDLGTSRLLVRLLSRTLS
jgi:hypothetical protein